MTKKDEIDKQHPLSEDTLNKVTNDISIADLLGKRLKNHIATLSNLKNGNLYGMVLKGVERPLIKMVLQETKGNQLKAANILGINRNTLKRKMKELGITKDNIFAEED